MAAATEWAAARGWRQKLGKKGAYEQSLLEHTLIELDVLLELLPILSSPRHYNLSEAEQEILLVAVLAHDVGKEIEAWQAYIRDPQHAQWVGHVIPELTRSVTPNLGAALGFEGLDEPVERIMAHCSDFHHSRPGRADGAILEAMLTGGTDRFLTLATLVKSFDHVCSAASAGEAIDAIERDPSLGHHLKAVRHEVVVRGVSTTFLHRAARAAFQQNGWRALLYFSNATVYVGDPTEQLATPTLGEIRSSLERGIHEAMDRDVAPLMVGSPTGNVLPKPDLFSFAESRQYLESAAQKVGMQSFSSAYQREKKRVREQGAPGPRTGPGKLKAEVIREYWGYAGEAGDDYGDAMDRDAGRISVAQPEMMVFKFFKAAMDPDKVAAVGKDGADVASTLYEKAFGPGSWAALQSTSTIMPARDMARTVDRFWALPGAVIDHPEVQRVAELPDAARLQALIDVLDGIAQSVYAAIARPSPRDELSRNMAEAFSLDLLRPAAGGDARGLAQQQLDHYTQSKPFAGRQSAKGVYLCPICSAPFDLLHGVKASADFIDNPQTHTNRGTAYGSFGYVMVCSTCYYERLLVQVVLGSRPQEMITLLPRLNVGPGRGQQLVDGVRGWVETAKAQMRGDAGDLESGFSLGLTDQAARHLGGRDPFGLKPEELLSLFSYRFTAETQKKRKSEAMRRLKEEFDDDLGAAQAATARPFATWEAAVGALIANQVIQQEFGVIRREVFRLQETIHLICQTPNLVFIPLSYEVAAGNDESEAGKAWRRLYVALILSIVFDAAVAIHKEGEPVDFQVTAGAAFVPPVPAVRSLVGHDWLPIVEAPRWLAAIGAASQLARDSGLSPRSALHQILAEDPPERLVRRVEEHLAKEGRSLTADHLRLIERMPLFRTATKEKRA